MIGQYRTEVEVDLSIPTSRIIKINRLNYSGNIVEVLDVKKRLRVNLSR